MLNTENSIKRWTILDRRFDRIHDVTDEFFANGLENHIIELRGQFIQVENNHKIWVDGIVKQGG